MSFRDVQLKKCKPGVILSSVLFLVVPCLMLSCTPRQYTDTINNLCMPCHYSCATCSTATVCSSCEAVDHRELSGELCLPQNGYFDNGTATCAACSMNCLVCSNNTNCLVCLPHYKVDIADGSAQCALDCTLASSNPEQCQGQNNDQASIDLSFVLGLSILSIVVAVSCVLFVHFCKKSQNRKIVNDTSAQMKPTLNPNATQGNMLFTNQYITNKQSTDLINQSLQPAVFHIENLD